MNSVCSRRATTLTCILFLIVQTVLVDAIYAQKTVTVRGVVLDKRSNTAVPNATLKLSKNKPAVADIDGKFKFNCMREDTLLVTAMGYCPRLLIVHDLLTDSAKCKVYLQPLVYQLRSVQITAKKKESNITKALNLLAGLSHPFTYFSREEILKRRLAKLKATSVFFSENIYWQINRQIIIEISKLSGEDLDKCIIYCNTHIVLSDDDDERTITNKLLLVISDYFKSTTPNPQGGLKSAKQ